MAAQMYLHGSAIPADTRHLELVFARVGCVCVFIFVILGDPSAVFVCVSLCHLELNFPRVSSVCVFIFVVWSYPFAVFSLCLFSPLGLFPCRVSGCLSLLS